MFKSIFGLKKTFKDFKKEFIKQNIRHYVAPAQNIFSL